MLIKAPQSIALVFEHCMFCEHFACTHIADCVNSNFKLVIPVYGGKFECRVSQEERWPTHQT